MAALSTLKLRQARLLFALLFLLSFGTARGAVFETDARECYRISKVVGDQIFYCNESTNRDERLDVNPSNYRFQTTLDEAHLALKRHRPLCGTEFGIFVDSQRSGFESITRYKDNLRKQRCLNERKSFKAEKRKTGFLNADQLAEVEGVYATCMAGRKTQRSWNEKVNHYYACRKRAAEATAACRADFTENCLTHEMQGAPLTFVNRTDFEVLFPHSETPALRCLIDGKAPNRRELNAPRRN